MRDALRHPFGVPNIPALFDPTNVADHCGLYFVPRDRIDTDCARDGEAAGLWDRDRSTVLVSRRFPYEVQRFTAAHEIGHFILHPRIGHRTLHRDFPVDGPRRQPPPLEREADHFAACLLMPRQAVMTVFSARFGTRHPLPLTDAVAFHLKADERLLFAQGQGSLTFAELVSKS